MGIFTLTFYFIMAYGEKQGDFAEFSPVPGGVSGSGRKKEPAAFTAGSLCFPVSVLFPALEILHP